jgi:hypothetical protein
MRDLPLPYVPIDPLLNESQRFIDFVEAAQLHDDPYAEFYIHKLLLFAGRSRVDGNLGKMPARSIAKACFWSGDADVFVDALMTSGWLVRDGSSGELSIEGWERHGGKVLEKREYWKNQKRTARYNAEKSKELPRNHIPNKKTSNRCPKDVQETSTRSHPLKCEVEVEVKEDQKKDQSQNTLSPSTPSVSADRDRSKEVLEVFAHYRGCGHLSAHPKPKSTSKEWKSIRARIADGYTVDDLKKAIDGMHMTPHNLGENERGQKYLGLELCMRDAGQVERFRETSEHGPPVRQKFLSKQDQSFVNALQHAEKFNAEVRNTGLVQAVDGRNVFDVPRSADADDCSANLVVEARRLAP